MAKHSYQKERVPVVMNGEKVGIAEISDSGSVIATINSPTVASYLQFGNIEHLTIEQKTKE